MYCGKCGKEIPEGEEICPECGWQKTVQHFAAMKAVPFKKVKKKMELPGELKRRAGPGRGVEEEAEAEAEPGSRPEPPPYPDVCSVQEPRADFPVGVTAKAPSEPEPLRIPPRFRPAVGCFTVGILAVILFLTGAVLLFNHRGFAWEIWKENEPEIKTKKGSEKKKDPLMDLRDELLSISAQISGMEKGLPHNPQKIKNRLDKIEKEIDTYRSNPQHFRVYALHKSVEFQFNLTEESKIDPEIPALPYSPITPKPDDEYVLKDISPGKLLKSKILTGGKSKFIRYGPALMSFDRKLKTFSSLFYIDAPKKYKYLDVAIGIDGNVELIEYSVRMLDDYRRAYPAFLDAEKEARKKKMLTDHILWRDTMKTERNHLVYLHRIFLLPADSIKKPILEIKRQGSSKMVWVQY